MLSLWAVHIPDGLLHAPAIWGGGGLALALAAIGAWRLSEEEIPRLALLTAAFFVASSIRIPIPGPSHAHLLLNGLVGVVLGWRSAVAIPIALFLQAALLGHGGFFSLGVNVCVMLVPALLGRVLFVLLSRWVVAPPASPLGPGLAPLTRPLPSLWLRSALVATGLLALAWSLTFAVAFLTSYHAYRDTDLENAGRLAAGYALRSIVDPWILAGTLMVIAAVTAWKGRSPYSGEAALGFLIGVLTVLATVALNSLVLVWGGFTQAALLSFLAHVPIAVIEGIVLAFTVSFLARVKPELLGLSNRRVAAASGVER